jgi:hypothetical protein
MNVVVVDIRRFWKLHRNGPVWARQFPETPLFVHKAHISFLGKSAIWVWARIPAAVIDSVLMSRWTAPSTVTGLLVVLSTIISGCSHSEKDATGYWASEGIVLRISRGGEHGEYYTVEWKEPGRMTIGSFGGQYRDGRIQNSLPMGGDLTYSRGRDVVLWRDERFHRVSPEEYTRAGPRR